MTYEKLISTPAMLVVDDRAEDLLSLELILEDCGADLVKASSGVDALREVLRRDFAVILLDVSMPGMDGFEVAELIKRASWSRHIPIIFLTAEGTDIDSIYRGYKAGGVDFILKPLDPDVVKAKVAVFVELHRRGLELRWQAELIRAAELAEVRDANEKRYRNLAEAIPQIVWTAQPSGEATYFNQRWVDHTGLDVAEALGKGWQSAIHPDDVERFVDRWRRALAVGEPLRVECRLRSSFGVYRHYLCDALPERDQDNRLLGWLGTFTDVNDRKRLEEESARALLREQMARVDAEQSVRRLELLTEAGDVLAQSRDARSALQGIAELVTRRLASWCVIDVVDAEGAIEQVAFVHRDEALNALGGELAKRISPAGPLRTGRPEVSTAPCDAEALTAVLGAARAEVVSRLGAESYISAPLSARGQVLGAMTVVSSVQGHAFGPADVAVVVDLGLRAALALDNARLHAQAKRALRPPSGTKVRAA
jgi:PAS domain S-box-containing protein